ncbi:uncharacterized protein HMPREF1541_11059 [Cyphellophora europaea CBS 101466]|uniref:Xaa-Pro dipeptidyl-peptidase-like domain-containing protein n=1 Tax=Cyphellophora europaea (strain CBS 101466) TaxID=1220924 RepID=W2S7C2_CYPE1|nr:uncharacterized protein HMPREF1541_11059 [Cyphellophora europaea CBS 101466]ETN43928.1 hypothetical protein HMPREF1541_11059 [Cyphellophora europaea CBS 101466]
MAPPREDISFQTSDGLTLRGWLYKSALAQDGAKLPCLVMSHGWSALKEMDLDAFAERFVAKLPIACLVYDNRCFGASDGQPRHEIIPALQHADMSDAITYAQSLEGVKPEKIGIWGSSYSGAHVLHVGAVDKRVKAVLSQVPLADGYTNFQRLIRCDFVSSMNQMFQDDRLARAAGKDPGRLPVVDADPMKPSALPTADSFVFFDAWAKKSDWKNDCTVRSVEMLRGYHPSAQIHRIAPTPLLMTVAENDVLTPTDIALEAYSRALEPKRLHVLPGGHFDGYTGPNFDRNTDVQAEFLKQYLCN